MLRAEFTNFLRVRSYVTALFATAVAFVLVAFLSALQSHSGNIGNNAVPIGPDGDAVSDTYTFLHQSLTGDGSLTARVTSLSGESQLGSQLQPGLAPWAKAGIILEPGTSNGTVYAAVMVTGSHGVRMQYDYTHDSPGLTGPVSSSSPRWLRLVRVGDVITGYDSPDGARWTEIGTARLTGLSHTVQIGLFVTSPVYFTAGTEAGGGISSLATANFDQVSARGGISPGSWTGDVIGGFYPVLQSASPWRQGSTDTFILSGSGDIAPLVGDVLFPLWSGACIVNGTIVGLLILIVLAALFATSQDRRDSVSTTPVAPKRRLLAARAVVLGSLAFTAGGIATAIAEPLTRHVLAANGNYLFPQGGPDVARVIVGTGLFMGLAAVLIVALGAMLRSSLWTIVAGIVLIMLPGVLVTVLPPGSEEWLMKLTPTAAFAIQATLPQSNLVSSAYTIFNGYFPISPWGGLAVLTAYTAVALGAAIWISPPTTRLNRAAPSRTK